MGSITLFDWSIWLVYLVLILILTFIYRSTRREDQYRFLIKGLLIKIFGGLAFALIYVYYYKYGDTFLYHRGASIMAETLLDAPLDYFSLLFSNNNDLPPDLYEFSESIEYSRTVEEWFMVKLLSPLSFFGFGSYLVVTLFASLISFYGGWKLFLVFHDLLPKYSKYGFYAVFLTPTIVFWGGGIMKDTVTLCCINLIIYHLYFGALKLRFGIGRIITIVIASYMIFSLKAYIILAFIPGLIYSFYLRFKYLISSNLLRIIIGPAIFGVLLLISFFGLQSLSESSSQYNTDSLKYRVKGFHSWHTTVGGSTYNLGEVEYTAPGLISKVPAALNVTFFRPYIWEAKSVVILVNALESLFLFGLFVFALFSAKFQFFKIIGEKPILAGLFIYSLIFGFAVGFTSYNFGALARYKIPIYALFIFILIYIIIRSRNQEHSDKIEALN